MQYIKNINHKKILFILISIVTIVLFIFSPLNYAKTSDTKNTDWYQINIIIFKHITPKALNSELWPMVKSFPDIDHAITPELLSENDSQLKEEANRLSKQKNYKILSNISWKQQIPKTNKDAEPIHIMGGDYFNGFYQVDGTITINRRRYFDISTNLILTELTSNLNKIGLRHYAENSEEDTDFKSFQLKQSLRLRSGELGYIYNPIFGVLIKIVKVYNNSN